MYPLIKEWVERLTVINLDRANENYVKAYDSFANGDFDGISRYLPDEWLEQRTKHAERQKEEGKQQLELLQALTEVAKQNVKIADAELADIAMSYMLKAKAMALENKYEQAISYYEKAINIDPSNADNIWEFAYYLHAIREYSKAEIYYKKCLEIYRKLADENPKAYLPDVATTLNNLGVLHSDLNEYSKALKEYEETLEIRSKLADENPKAYLPDVAMTLNNLANLHSDLNEYPKALKEYEEALEIRRKLADENSKAYLPYVAGTLNNLGILHSDIHEYSKALKEYEESLEIYRKLADENPKAYLPNVADTLNNLANLHSDLNEYSKALKECEEALEIHRKFADENPKVYVKNVAETLGNLSGYYLFTKEYLKSEQSARKALELDGASFAKTNLAHALLFQNHFSEAEKIYKELSQTVYRNNETYTQILLDDFDALEKAGVIPESRKADVEKIRKILKQ